MIFRRITSYACECGYIKLLKIDTKKNSVVYNFSTRFGNYISRVQIFPENENVSNFTFEMNGDMKTIGGDEKSVINEKPTTKKINLVVINTILPAVIFQ